MNKVYCKDCKHFKSGTYYPENTLNKCLAITLSTETFFSRYDNIKYGDPEKINKDNNCELFYKKRPLWKWWMK